MELFWRISSENVLTMQVIAVVLKKIERPKCEGKQAVHIAAKLILGRTRKRTCTGARAADGSLSENGFEKVVYGSVIFPVCCVVVMEASLTCR